jgi:NAD(P)H dehydrogenase (quinone)
MSLVVTAASGQFGRLVVQSLLARGVPADQIVAGSRDPGRIADLAEAGVITRRIDYADAGSLTSGFAGADRVLLVSGTDFGRRVEQHTAAAQAAAAAGASVIYTSAPRADSTPMLLATEHRGTEEAIRAIGVPFTFLRNGWYFENYTPPLPQYLAGGVVLGTSGEGRISGASRADLADAAAVVLTGEGHDKAVYELAGDTSFTMAEFAAIIARLSGKPVEYRDVPEAEYAAALVAGGVPQPVAELLADTGTVIRRGALEENGRELSRLIGRPTSTIEDAVAAALA